MKKLFEHLVLVKQGDNEPLDKYARRFNDETMQVEDYTVQTILAGL